MGAVQITYCISDTLFWYLIFWQHLPYNFCSLAITNNTTCAFADGSVVHTSSYKQVICFLNGRYLPEIFNCQNNPLPCSRSHHRVPIRLLSSPERPRWHSLLSAGLRSCDEALSWSWLEREAVSLEEFSIRNIYISYFCELMQNQGWLGQCSEDGVKRRVRNMGRFVCPFTSIYEISEMVILARTFAWGEGDRTERVRKLLILYICVTIYAIYVLEYIQYMKRSGFSSCSGTKPLRAPLKSVERTWNTFVTAPRAWHSASGIPRAACADRVESTGSIAHFWQGLVQNPSKTDCAFPVPPLALSPPQFFDKGLDLEKTHLS